ncbi:uncharacterized protein PV07_03421 [Cladophialophora immunda]|uniref:Xylanolytic transcriptional activator regulatory domain-containing protein n=1 Tax=Cladophialophora immunda TaxID=569365 RepID=A0A0D2CKW8_9EURO|nr:uncharacterized protein PV07_03421 [Cladophialophora immunda]KIW31828.1 hypothetical protein PV07_03421 [Cladophialophora immunda]
MSPQASLVNPTVGNVSDLVNRQLLEATAATTLPPPLMVEALTEAFFMHLHPRMPIVDRADVEVAAPSIVLIQALCMVGSLIRHPKGSSPLAETELLYAKVKALLQAGVEKDNLTTLKALCLFSCWNVTPPSVVSLDCAWFWLGATIRFALHMGLHQESTVSKYQSPAARRIAWYLFASAKYLPSGR